MCGKCDAGCECLRFRFPLPSLPSGKPSRLHRRTTATDQAVREKQTSNHPEKGTASFASTSSGVRAVPRQASCASATLPFLLIYLLAHNTAFDSQLSAQPVHISPFQGECFADA